MKLARKLTAALVIGIVVVMASYAYFQIRQEVVLSKADFQRAQRVALAWLGTMEAVWEHEGPARAHELAALAAHRARDIALRILTLDSAVSENELSAEERRILAGGQVVRRNRTDAAGNGQREIYVLLAVPGNDPTVVEYIEPTGDEQTFISMSHLAIGMATLAVVAVCGLIATGLQYSLVGRPLRLLRDKARRAGAGDFSHPLLLSQNDEIGDLARDINAMCEHIATGQRQLAEETAARIAALEQLRHTDRLATVGRLAAGVAHELGTPLNVVSARAELIAANEPTRSDVAGHARIIAEQADRMTNIIHQFLDFSRRGSAQLSVTDLRHVIVRTLDLLSSVADRSHVVVRYNAPSVPLLARVDPNQIQQALTNVLLNGIQSMRKGGELQVRAESVRVQAPEAANRSERSVHVVEVADVGCGIPSNQIVHIFEPFFTTKLVGEGTGLGLAVAHGIITEHGGWIAVDSEVGRGTRFSIFLPQLTGGQEAAVA
jgi:signal transduction histidine kinase